MTTPPKNKLRAWIEAMRLRTLPVSLAGVAAAAGIGLIYAGRLRPAPLILCALFALLAQIASNFANEYYDYTAGLDRPGREGPRRGVTEGDITPVAMKRATFITLALACAVGCGLICWGGWWLVAAGAFIAVGALAYSTGPWPLSRHGLGEVAVILFFGIVPVCLTFSLATGMAPGIAVVCASAGLGLLGANVLVVNNYRDRDDDASVGKHTLAVILGPRAMKVLYAANAVAGIGLTLPVWIHLSPWAMTVPALFLIIVAAPLCRRICREHGRALNPLLGATARAMALYALALVAAGIIGSTF